MNKIKSVFAWFLKDKKRLIAGLIIIGILVFGYIRLFGKKAATTQIQTAQVQKGTIVSSVSASGSILTANTIPITTEATGIVSKVYVKDGQTVFQGQKLAEIKLDQAGAQANTSAYANLVNASNSYQDAQNNLRSAEATLARVYDDIKGHATDETLVMKETRTKVEVTHDNSFDQVRSAQVNLAAVSLSYRNSSPIVTAPYSGTVGNITVVEGMTLSTSSSSTTTGSQGSGQRIAVIEIKGTPIASFNVSEVDVSKVIQGQKATIILDSITDKTFTGKVASVDKMGVTSNGVTNYPIIIQFDTESPDILPNMTATVNIILESKSDVLLVPSSAVTTANGQSTVKVMRNGSEVTVPVEIGLASSTQVEITSGLSEGDTVVTGTTSTSTGSQQTSVFSTGGFGGALRGR